jgi:hypothetical protein
MPVATFEASSRVEAAPWPSESETPTLPRDAGPAASPANETVAARLAPIAEAPGPTAPPPRETAAAPAPPAFGPLERRASADAEGDRALPARVSPPDPASPEPKATRASPAPLTAPPPDAKAATDAAGPRLHIGHVEVRIAPPPAPPPAAPQAAPPRPSPDIGSRAYGWRYGLIQS